MPFSEGHNWNAWHFGRKEEQHANGSVRCSGGLWLQSCPGEIGSNVSNNHTTWFKFPEVQAWIHFSQCRIVMAGTVVSLSRWVEQSVRVIMGQGWEFVLGLLLNFSFWPVHSYESTQHIELSFRGLKLDRTLALNTILWMDFLENAIYWEKWHGVAYSRWKLCVKEHHVQRSKLTPTRCAE